MLVGRRPSPALRAIRVLWDKVRAATVISKTERPVSAVVAYLHPVLRGWAVYFRNGNSGRKFSVVDSYLHEQLAIFTSRKHGQAGRNWVTRNTCGWITRLGVHRLTGHVHRATATQASRCNAGEPCAEHARSEAAGTGTGASATAPVPDLLAGPTRSQNAIVRGFTRGFLRRCVQDSANPRASGLDHFKAVNDSLGHAVGDVVLTATAARLTAWAGPRAAIGRLGGDEFAIVLHLPHGRREVRLAQLVGMLHAPVALDGGQAVDVAASVGATTPDVMGPATCPSGSVPPTPPSTTASTVAARSSRRRSTPWCRPSTTAGPAAPAPLLGAAPHEPALRARQAGSARQAGPPPGLARRRALRLARGLHAGLRSRQADGH
ncbi:diguanylate cyclase domain-containing protein [Streptomyces sp. NPDC002889]|uniref:diguanylate cyclase domain-containing protein n=1 Tax=Streptomyces sp. NPDC002889 TaxID=3364669 RepID=UPI003682B8D3